MLSGLQCIHISFSSSAIMRPLLAIAVVVLTLPLSSQQPKSKSQKPQQSSTTEQRGTQGSPVVVKVLPTSKTPEEAAQDKKDRDNKTANDRNLVYLTGVLAAVGFLQLLVFAYQARKLRQTVKSAGEQAEAMERHIGQAARSATAMENIANTIEAGNQAVLRAYLTVTIGIALFQQRREGQSDLKFEGRPNLVNAGNTPARNVRIQAVADILPIPIPADFLFALPKDGGVSSTGVVGAHQTNVFAGIVDRFVPDSEIAEIKEGRTKALCVWGLITYEDIFGKTHNTKFGQWITWLPNDQIFGYYIPGQNDAD